MRQEANAKRDKKGGESYTVPAEEESDEQALEAYLTDVIGRTLTHKLNK